MNRDQKKARRREKRLNVKERKAEKAIALEDLDYEDDNDLPVLETENVQKDYSVSNMVSSPISFEELEEERVVLEEEEAFNKVTNDTQRLVSNIIFSSDLDPGEKVDAITTVAEEFASRLEVEEDEIEKDLSGDIELLQLEAVIAHDKRSTPTTEYFEDLLTKAILSASKRNKMDDDKFALVTTRNGKKVRKYPCHDKAHVRNALSRAAQQIKRGGQGASDARKALPKIHSAAKKMGVGSSMEKERNAILIEKDIEGNWRWVGWVSNNFIDWDGDIISELAHKEYVDWWEKNRDVSPVFISWHTPGTARKEPVDFMMYENGFLIMSGILQENEAAGLLKAQAKTDLGMSHGTFVLARDVEDPRVIRKYRMYEVSDLPLSKAANPFTDFETIVKEVDMDKKQYLTQILGSEEKADAFLEKTGLKQKQLQAAEVESKEKDVIEEVVPEPVAPESAPVEPVPPAPNAEEIVAKVMKELDIEGLNAFVLQAKEAIEKVPILESLIEDLQGAQDEKLAEMLTPPASRFAWTQNKRASQDDENVVEPEEKKKVAPGVPDGYWLSEASGTTPIQVQ